MDRNPALEPLAILVGEWAVEFAFPGDPPATMQGRVTFEWVEGGAFLVMRSIVDADGPPTSTAVIGRDDAAEPYSMLYVDERGVSRIYVMTLKDGVWTLRRTAPGLNQRFTGVFEQGGDVISARWLTSTDGSRWEHDFALTYTRMT